MKHAFVQNIVDHIFQGITARYTFPLEIVRAIANKANNGSRRTLRIPQFIGIHASPKKWLKCFLGVLPFVLIALIYTLTANARHAENEYDKMVPLPSQIWVAIGEVTWDSDAALEVIPEGRSASSVVERVRYYAAGISESLFVRDTLASLKRLAIGALSGAFLALLLGLNMALFRGMEAASFPMMTFLSIMNPLALLPILLVALGVDELSKYVLIAIGVFFTMTLIMYKDAKNIATPEQKTKAFTLGASQLDVVYRVVLPQLWPSFILALALSLGPAWIFLVSSEAISASEGLGKRIFLVYRQSRMDIIIPYVLWMTVFGSSIVYALKRFSRMRYPWYSPSS